MIWDPRGGGVCHTPAGSPPPTGTVPVPDPACGGVVGDLDNGRVPTIPHSGLSPAAAVWGQGGPWLTGSLSPNPTPGGCRRRPSSSCSCTPSTPRLAAQQRGQDTLEPHCCKAAVAERIVELIEELPDNSPPGAILANSLIAVGNLSTMTPALEPELETHLLRAALHAVFTLGMEKDTTQVQDLPRVLPDLLDAMLGNLLAESPDTDRLQYILEVSPMRGVGAILPSLLDPFSSLSS
ncbi:uncharacterized protein LOC135972763 [Chrysemys picta bellii]|uniref:uncharacterized protein LOC135972763 n=1 Tax=Chrysemys picta bellii TaxID=8478 RepID=UPI0032B2AF8B